MKKFWVRPDGNDEEEDERFEFRKKIAIALSILIFMFVFFVAFPYWDKKTDEYWRQEALRGSPDYKSKTLSDSIHIHVFREH